MCNQIVPGAQPWWQVGWLLAVLYPGEPSSFRWLAPCLPSGEGWGTVTVNKSFKYQARPNMVLLSKINGSWNYCLHSQWGINDSNWVHMGTSSIFLKACNDFAQLGHCVQHSGTRQMAGCLSFQVNPGFCLPSWHLLLGWLPGSVPCGLPLKIWDGMGTWDGLVIWGF